MWLIVLNRRSGKGYAKRFSQQLIAQLQAKGIKFHIIDEDSAQQTQKQLQKQLTNPEFENIVAIGGDGLVHLCIQHLVNSKSGFAVIPAGIGNDFARCMGFHKLGVEEICNIVLNTRPISIDLGCVRIANRTEWFVQVLSTGFDSNVNKFANTITKLRGRVKYTIAMLLVLTKFKPIKYSVNIDGEVFNLESMLFLVANGGNYGGGMKICPSAINTDGRLDLISIDPVSRFTLLRIFPRVFRGTHVNHPKVRSYTGKKIQLIGDTLSYADGEYISRLPIEISVSEGALKTWKNS